MKQIGSIEKIRKFNAIFDSSFVSQVAENLAVSPHYHGQFATCGNWRQGCPPWLYTPFDFIMTALNAMHSELLTASLNKPQNSAMTLR
jgi:hypothetical protein